jgi:hypothetical protein
VSQIRTAPYLKYSQCGMSLFGKKEADMGPIHIELKIANLPIEDFFTKARFEAYGLEPMVALRACGVVRRGAIWDWSKGYQGERIMLKTVGEFVKLYLPEDKLYCIEGVGPRLEDAILGVLKPYTL